jgi:hypothetical protein
MRAVVAIMADILREAAARKWFVGLGLVLTAVIGLMALTLRMDVVDGALAATRLFGRDVGSAIRPADVALRPVFEAAAYVVFYGGLVFGILACSDFGPELLSPGRVEHLLSLPLRRVELLLGTFAGVMALCVLGTVYGAGGFLLVLSTKSGVWTLRPLLGALLSAVPFFAIYAAMLTTAVFVRSAPLCAASGGVLFSLGIVAGYRESIAALFEPGFSRGAFQILTAPLPRIADIAELSSAVAVGTPVGAGEVWRPVTGTLAFGAALLAVGAWQLDKKDF